MKIEMHPYSLRLATPMVTAHGEIEQRKGILLSLSDGDHTGWGEASPILGWSLFDLDAVTAILTAVVSLGTDDLDHSLSELAKVPGARAAVSGAMADLAARQAGVPLADHLVAGTARKVAVNTVIGHADPEAAAEAAKAAVAAGIETLKVKVGVGSLADDLDRIAEIRLAIGVDAGIRLDANGGWKPNEAALALQALAPFGIEFCEEPTAGIDAIAELAADSPIPLAVDESARTLEDVTRAIDTGVLGATVLKPQAIGGPDFAVAAAAHAEEAGVNVIVTTMIDSAVGAAHAAHVAAAVGGPDAHGLATSALLVEDIAPPLPVTNGVIDLTDTVGLGVTPH